MAAKMVIVLRKDLNMRKGKMVAQGAHAACDVVSAMERTYSVNPQMPSGLRRKVEAYREWGADGSKKVCVSVNSEAELGAAYQKALEAGMPCSMVTDSGLTEFHGVPTKTAVAIGPWDEAEVDKITGEMPLL